MNREQADIDMDYSAIRGFNYQPSYGTTSLENWVYFQPDVIEREMQQGKEYFPGFNTVRYWLSWDAYYRRPEEFKTNFEKMLVIADRLGIKVVPCLLNRWHDHYDNGGVYLDNFAFPTSKAYFRPLYLEYVKDIVKEHRNDSRIILWDICNEPFSYNRIMPDQDPYVQSERIWLTELYESIKTIDDKTPAGVSVSQESIGSLKRVNQISDVLMIHPYLNCKEEFVFDPVRRKRFVDYIDEVCAYGKEVGKPILVTETCWGALDDQIRVEQIKFTLGVLTDKKIGFLAHALHYSRIADLHDWKDGSVCVPGNLAFTTRDGKLRPGHEIFNQF